MNQPPPNVNVPPPPADNIPIMPEQRQRPNDAALVANILATQKIPEPIKLLQEYSGDRTSLYRFINDVENILQAYQALQHTPEYQVWGQVIIIIIIRDIATITQQIPYLRQGDKSLDDFNKETNQLVADINQKISLDPQNNGHVQAIMRILEPIVMTGFVDGLNGFLPNLVRSHDPTNLLDAFKAAQKHEQANMRARERNFRLNAFKPQPKQVRATTQNNFWPRNAQNLQQNPNFRNGNHNYGPSYQNNPNFVPRGGNQNVGPPQSQNNPNFIPRGGNQNAGPPQPQNNPYRDVIRQAGPSNNQRYAGADRDVSMRSRQSVPMSGISYRSQQLYNAEGEEIPDMQEEIPDYEENPDDQDSDPELLNFQMDADEPHGT